MQMKYLTAAVACALAVMSTGHALAAQGVSSSQDAYLQAVAPGVEFTAVLTTGDAVGGYRMAGLPDGLGAYDNGDNTFTVLMNHEFGAGSGAASHGTLGAGSFISEWVINKTTLQVVSGGDLIKNVYGWDAATQQSSTVASLGVSFNRFCSADLAQSTAFYNAATGVGTTARIFLNGEEGGANGRALATVATGAAKGSTFVLGKMNQSTNASGVSATGAWENLLANPFAQNKTVVIGNNDGGTGMMNNALAVYVGTKQATGTDVDKAGLTNGTTKFVNIAGVTNEISNSTTRSTGIADGARFTLDATKSTTFSRPEDGAWSADGKTYYFVTTDQLDKTELTGQTQKGGTRLWAMNFDDISNPDAGGSIKTLIDTSTTLGGLGATKPNMFDNIAVNKDGTLTILEDVGNAEHNGKIWNFDPVSGKLTMMGKFDPALFGDVTNGSFVAGTHTKDEETSGVIDITSILGRNDGKQYSLLVAQDHASAASLGLADPTAMVEGGQLLVMAAVPEPESYAMMLAGLGMIGFAARRRSAQ